MAASTKDTQQERVGRQRAGQSTVGQWEETEGGERSLRRKALWLDSG